MNEILVAKDLKKTYFSPERCDILKGINLNVKRGETVAIMGPSGVGKSTLLHLLGTLDAPSSGSLFIAGKRATKDNGPALRGSHIGFIFQNYNLLDEYTVLENVLMPSRIRGGKGKEAEARGLLEKVGLSDHLSHVAKQLSGGEKQRAAIARALCNDPDLILADEPSGNLDKENSQRIHELLMTSAKALNKGLIVVTHNMDLAKECDMLYTLHNGSLNHD